MARWPRLDELIAEVGAAAAGEVPCRRDDDAAPSRWWTSEEPDETERATPEAAEQWDARRWSP